MTTPDTPEQQARDTRITVNIRALANLIDERDALRAQVEQYRQGHERWQFWRVRFDALTGMDCARRAGIDLSSIYVNTPEKMDAVTDAAIDKARKA